MKQVMFLACSLFAAATATANPAPPAPPQGGRTTIFSDNFESAFPGGWERKGHVPTNASWFTGAPKRGTHSVQYLGLLATAEKDQDALMERTVSTVGYTDIEVSFSMGASGMDKPTEVIWFWWMEKGFSSPNELWHNPKSIKGGDGENDGRLHHYSYALSERANNNPKLALFFGLGGTDGVDDYGYVDDIVVTGRRAGGDRVTIFSDDFETELSASWIRKGNVPTNVARWSGAAKRGAHSVRFTGSPSTVKFDCDSAMQRAISTVGHRKIQVSFWMGASGLPTENEAVEAWWSRDGLVAGGEQWQLLKRIQGGDGDHDGALHRYTFSLPPEADNNPKFGLHFGVWGLQSQSQRGYVDDVEVTGE